MPLLSSLRQRLAADPRLSRMLHGSASSVLGRGVAMLVGAVSLPLTVRYLGKLEYGVWVTISTTVSMLSVLDLGIANTLTNRISEAFADNDTERAEQYYATAFWLTVGICAVLFAVVLAIWPHLPFDRLFNLADEQLARQTRLALLISVIFFLLTMPMNLANRVLAGYQRTHISNYFAMANAVIGLGGVLLAMALHGSIVLMMACYCGALLLGNLALNVWTVTAHQPSLRPWPRRARRSYAGSLFQQGSLFFLLQLTTLVVFNTDNLVITHYLGAAQVTPYSVAWRLISYVALIQGLLIPATWPAFTEAYQQRQMDWVRSRFHALAKRTLQVTAVAALAVALLGRFIIRVWAGGAAVPPPLLLWTMAFWAVLVCVTTNQAILLTATSRLKVETISAVTAAVVNLVLSIVLVQRIGPEGVILSTILSFLICMVVPQELEVRRVLAGRYLPAAPISSTPAELELTADMAEENDTLVVNAGGAAL